MEQLRPLAFVRRPNQKPSREQEHHTTKSQWMQQFDSAFEDHIFRAIPFASIDPATIGFAPRALFLSCDIPNQIAGIVQHMPCREYDADERGNDQACGETTIF